ncbi:Beta-carotene 15,15'-monooxygenase [Flavobacterium longum]|uniref:hypothetical protein n=1 Tax=Flavobacterium longum TaxID=1299340 RepID=UPI0039E85188
MDELDLLKKDWQRKSFEQVSESEIYKMIHRKSSSIVKWILIISILEVLLWTGVGLISSADDYLKPYSHDGILVVLKVVGWVNYAVVLVFIYLFYKNYVTISATSATRTLMQNILKTRKTVKYYVWYNLAMVALSFIAGLWLALYYSDNGILLREKMEHETKIMWITLALLLCVVALAVFIFWLFYRLLYGILLRKLLANYKELKKIDLEN